MQRIYKHDEQATWHDMKQKKDMHCNRVIFLGRYKTDLCLSQKKDFLNKNEQNETNVTDHKYILSKISITM